MPIGFITGQLATERQEGESTARTGVVRGLPSGQVTLLLTDIEDLPVYSAFWRTGTPTSSVTCVASFNMHTLVCLLRSLRWPASSRLIISTDRQGKSGLGIEAQQAAVRGYLGASMPIAEFTEIETGKRNDRPELERALALCRKRKAKLVIAKLDRLSRNLAFIAALMD